jgi:glucose/arabinose dehydrogenase
MAPRLPKVLCLGALCLGALALAACGGGGDDEGTRPEPSTTTTTAAPATTTTTVPADLSAARVQLTPVAAVPRAIALATRPDDPTLYVAQQTGELVAVRDGAAALAPALDLTAKVNAGGERGFLGVAFSPDGTHLAVHYSGSRGQTVVEEYAVTSAPDGAAQIDPASARELFTVEQPQANHNGGELTYGPDGLLYLGLGDGGAANDTGAGHAPEGNGQSVDTFLGKIVRIDPADGRAVQCFSGLRNPWRFSFDRVNQDLWIGDVGQNLWEEVDWVPDGTVCGTNFGWPIKEGAHAFRSPDAPGTVDPVFEVSHAGGDCAIVGGYVYRGTKIPDLVGSYLFSDNCNTSVRALRIDEAGAVTLQRELGVEADSLSSFGQDQDGELYVLSLSEGLFRIDAA